MKVLIKDLGIDMQVKAKGIEFEVRSPDGKKHKGDLYLTMSGLTWCKGRTSRSNGKVLRWPEFIAMMEER